MSDYAPFAILMATPWALANLIMLASKTWKGGVAFSLIVVFFSLGAILGAMALLIELFILIVLWCSCRQPERQPGRFALLSTALTALLFLALGVPEAIKYESLKKQFAFESMESRVPAPATMVAVNTTLKDVAAARLNEIEDSFSYATRPVFGNRRTEAIQRLHEDTSSAFIRSAGFGVARTFRADPTKIENEPIPAIPLPAQRDPSTGDWSDNHMAKQPSMDEPLTSIHLFSVMDFANPRGYGYVKNRREVAGFRSRYFQDKPADPPRMILNTLDLVGLLMHEAPVAYVSEHLPKMDELRDAPTRELDAFEQLGLKEIQQGEDLYARESDATLRLLGAIRATKQCTTCHACDRGDLLGAFSYTLKREAK